jgi:hypothetical protein
MRFIQEVVRFFKTKILSIFFTYSTWEARFLFPSSNVAKDEYPYSSTYMPTPSPNYNFGGDTSHSSGKDIIRWLELKAALRWGIFVRKKAAESGAQLVS